MAYVCQAGVTNDWTQNAYKLGKNCYMIIRFHAKG